MTKSNRELAEDIISMINHECDRNKLIQSIENRISWQMNDAFKMIKNINETSISETDRVSRIIELEQKFGIPKTHLT
jgi:hypothetical protein